MGIVLVSAYKYGRLVAFAFLMLTITIVSTGGYVYAFNPPYDPPYPFPPTFPVNNFDFIITTSTTMIKFQPGQTGALVIWVNLYCVNSTTTIRCDSTVMQQVSLQISGCPSGTFCSLDRQQVLLPPLSQGASNFVVYSFATTGSSITTITVTGTDQFGRVRSTSFGVAICYC